MLDSASQHSFYLQKEHLGAQRFGREEGPEKDFNACIFSSLAAYNSSKGDAPQRAGVVGFKTKWAIVIKAPQKLLSIHNTVYFGIAINKVRSYLFLPRLTHAG